MIDDHCEFTARTQDPEDFLKGPLDAWNMVQDAVAERNVNAFIRKR